MNLVDKVEGKVRYIPAKVRAMVKSVRHKEVEEEEEEVVENKSFESSKTSLKAREAVLFTLVPNFDKE